MEIKDNILYLKHYPVLWDNDYIEFKDGKLYCKDVILNPDFGIKGGEVTCHDCIWEKD